MSGSEGTIPESLFSSLKRIAGQLNEVVGQIPQQGATSFSAPGLTLELLEIANRLLAERKVLADLSPDGVFTNGPTNMLLDLYIHSWLNRAISVSSLTIASCIPQTTALRYIDYLEQHGLLAREGDRKDRRRVLVTLTPSGYAEISIYLTRVARMWAAEVQVRPNLSNFV